nr:PREDICTED: UPF0462 protein C4orf33 homolog [Apteryx mantelli mantelli]
MEFTVEHTWDGIPVSHEPVTVSLKSGNAGLLMEVSAPFFNDPPAPLGEPGKPFSRLWDYEAKQAVQLVLKCNLDSSLKASFLTYLMQNIKMEFTVEHTWDGIPVSHEPVTVSLKSGNAGLLMEVSAPFFNDPPAPLGEPGKPFSRLWDYEVVETFFLSDRTEQYLEVELCPHGQHLLLLLSGRRRVWKEKLPLEFEVTRMENKWEGKACLPWNYFPPCIDKFNAFAIHGSGVERKFEALYPVPQHELQEGQKPDFHRLEFFKQLNLKELMGEDWKQPESDIW